MKLTKTILAAMAAIVLASCSFGKDDVNKYTCGGYSDFMPPTKEDLQLFDSTYTSEPKLTVKSVSKQVVAGMNYEFRCTDPSGKEITVSIFQPLQGEGDPKITYISK